LQRVPEVLPGFVDVRCRKLGKSAWGRLQVSLQAGPQAGDLLAGLIGGGLQKRIGIGHNLLHVGYQFVFGHRTGLVGFRQGKPLSVIKKNIGVTIFQIGEHAHGGT
jgi:hypothetical protein